jgi:chromosome segregation ATPase
MAMAIHADSRLGRFIGALGYRPVPSPSAGHHLIQANSVLGRFLGALAEPGPSQAAGARMTNVGRVPGQPGRRPRRSPGTVHVPDAIEDPESAASRFMTSAMKQTELLTAASRQAIEGASSQLKDTQDQTKAFFEQLTSTVLQALTSVTEQNEYFIRNARETNQQVLQALVGQQMQPLLQSIQDILDQFGSQQAASTTAVSQLARGVEGIQTVTQDLAGSARALTGSTHSIEQSLAEMASSQERFASTIDLSAQGMITAATAMTDVKDIFRTELHERLGEMTSNITSASESLLSAQASLAATARALSASAAELTDATTRIASAVRQAAPVPISRRRWWLFWERRR